MSESFPGVKALEDMQLDLRAGEVLALVGENGAGKTNIDDPEIQAVLYE